jgi:hypothetical protein
VALGRVAGHVLSSVFLRFTCDELSDCEVLVHLTRRSLVVVRGEARYRWKHCVKSGDVVGRRLAMTFCELTAEFLEGGA